MRFFSSYYSDRLLWFRIFGKGLIIKDIRRHPLTFSERNGYKTVLKIGNYAIRVLKNDKDH